MVYKLTQRELDIANKISSFFGCSHLEPSLCGLCQNTYDLMVKMRKVHKSLRLDKSKKITLKN